MTTQITDIINQLKSYSPDKIVLFGSYADNTNQPGSDLDLLVVKETNKPFHDRLIDVRRMLRTTTPIDIFVFTRAEIEKYKEFHPFIKEILQKGKVIYQAD